MRALVSSLPALTAAIPHQNFALFAGDAAGSALTVTYYPAKNTTLGEAAKTFGGSLGGSALGFVLDEFIVDALVDLHLKKKGQQP